MSNTPKSTATKAVEAEEKSKNFTFEYNGKEYEFEKDFTEVRKPGWLRKNRRRDELDLVFTMLEAVAGDEALEAIDEMDEKEFEAFAKEFQKALGAGVGE